MGKGIYQRRWVVLVIFVMAGTLIGDSAGAQGRIPSSPNDPFFDKQWGLHNIKAPEAWRIADGSGTVIAVLDTDVDIFHPDLKRKIVKRNDFVPPYPDYADPHPRGTHIAGVAAAATNNRIGIAGTAPRAKIMPIRVLNSQAAGEYGWLAAAIRHAADEGADVVSIPLGFALARELTRPLYGLFGPDALSEAIAYAWEKGAVIVAPAGDSSLPLCSAPPSGSRILCVGAVGPNDIKSGSSNYDATLMRDYLVAPGGVGLSRDRLEFCEENIFSTWHRGARRRGPCTHDRGYGVITGTHTAAAFVSGVAALLVSQGLTNDDVVDRLLTTADDLGVPGRDPVYGYGRVNALRAVEKAERR